MSDESAFLRAISDDPADEASRLVFADWLEERGDWRAEFLRLDVTLEKMTGQEDEYADTWAHWEALRTRLDPTWLAIFGRSSVENCGLHFRFRCPQQWRKLTATELPTVRLCESCHKKVFYCRSIEEARDHAILGHCVAVDAAVVRQEDDLGEADCLDDDDFTAAIRRVGDPAEDEMMSLTLGLLEGEPLSFEELDDSVEELGPPQGGQHPSPPPPLGPPPRRRKPWWKFW